eukprot:PhM_4_TR4086/c0_g1_i1/m.35123
MSVVKPQQRIVPLQQQQSQQPQGPAASMYPPQQQQQQQQPMYTASTHPEQQPPMGIPVQIPQQQQQQQFYMDICACCQHPWDVFCDGCCCSYCMLGFQHNMIHTGQRGMNPVVCCGTLLVDMLCAAGFASAIMLTVIRGEIRTRYGIQGDVVSDFLLSCCCSPCVVCQLTQEMSAHGEFPGGVFANKPPPMRTVVQHGYRA